jgi:hypothetical protein
MNPVNWIPGFTWLKLAVWSAALLVVVGLLWKVYLTIYQRGVDATTATYVARDLEALKQSEKRSAALQAAADILTEEQNAKADNDRRRIADLTASLRNRPERPRASAKNTSSSSNCTGAGLYRADGEFLSWYAAEAARVSAALQRCETQYNKVRGAP